MICKLDIKVAQRDGKSYLKDAFVSQPFRIVPVGQYKSDDVAYLMIMSSSPGLLDGDEHEINISVAENAKLQLQTQAYQRLFFMVDKSTQTTSIVLNKGSIFSYVPHPVVPQKSSTFVSHNIVEIDEDCHFLLSDIVTCGRKMSGEVFEYNSFQNITEVYQQNKLVIKDNVLLEPKRMNIQGLTILEGFTHQGSLIYYNTAGLDVKSIIESFYESYGTNSEIEFGISKLEGNGFIIRVLGNGAEQLFRIFTEIQDAMWINLSQTINKKDFK